MGEIRRTPDFDKWLSSLKDSRIKAKIRVRIARLANGLFGDVKPARGGISELRIDEGPGYRIYFTRRGSTLFLLLVGGDKSTQTKDIEKALQLARIY